nr:proline-rich protein 36-like [Aegilops tauschii subsp. strangulata]
MAGPTHLTLCITPPLTNPNHPLLSPPRSTSPSSAPDWIGGIDPDAAAWDHVARAATAAHHVDLPIPWTAPTRLLLPHLLHLPDQIWATPLAHPTPPPHTVAPSSDLHQHRRHSPSLEPPRCRLPQSPSPDCLPYVASVPVFLLAPHYPVPTNPGEDPGPPLSLAPRPRLAHSGLALTAVGPRPGHAPRRPAVPIAQRSPRHRRPHLTSTATCTCLSRPCSLPRVALTLPSPASVRPRCIGARPRPRTPSLVIAVAVGASLLLCHPTPAAGARSRISARSGWAPAPLCPHARNRIARCPLRPPGH